MICFVISNFTIASLLPLATTTAGLFCSKLLRLLIKAQQFAEQK